MVDVTKAMESKYVNADLVRESPTKKAIIIDGGEYVHGTHEGKEYEKLQITVEIDGKQKLYSPNRDSCKNLSSEYGRNTEKWVGMIVRLTIQKVSGKDTLVAFPFSHSVGENE
jgi:hypothetical protein